MKPIPFGEYLPDQAAFGNPGGVNFLNVIPEVGAAYPTYAPFKELVDASTALDARAQGAGAGLDKSGNVSLFAGDGSKLYQLVDGAFSDKSKPGGYATVAADLWKFAQFGQRFMATNLTDDIQSFVLGVDTAFSDLSVTAPKARHITLMDPGFTMIGHTNDATDGLVPNRVHWAAFQDPTDWPTPGTADAETKQSDFNDMHSGGWVMALTGAIGGASGAVFMEKSIFRADYVGPKPIFRFTEIERSRGTPLENSVVNVGPFAIYYAEDGFRMFDGASSIQIGEGKIDKKFEAELDQNFLERVSAVADPVNKRYFIVYPGPGNVGGNPNKGLVFNWIMRRWAPFDLDCELLAQVLTTGFTLDALDTLGFTLETLPFTLDSRVWSGGRNILAAFTTAHKLAFFTGANKAATLETGEVDESATIKYVSGLRPIIDGGSPTASVGYRDAPGDAVAYTAPTAAGVDGMCPQHISARYVRARINQPAGAAWSQAVAVEPRMQNDGLR
jgi:hypothetical protein